VRSITPRTAQSFPIHRLSFPELQGLPQALHTLAFSGFLSVHRMQCHCRGTSSKDASGVPIAAGTRFDAALEATMGSLSLLPLGLDDPHLGLAVGVMANSACLACEPLASLCRLLTAGQAVFDEAPKMLFRRASPCFGALLAVGGIVVFLLPPAGEGR